MTESEVWRLLPFSAGPAHSELAAAEAMLVGLAHEPRPALRWYGAAGRALVLGSGQRLTDADGAALAAVGATLHKRASGGTAVLFVPGLFMQDIALPAAHPLRRDDVSESYRWLGAVWADALDALGVPAEPVSVAAARADSQATDALVRRACFGGISPYEVMTGGRKLVGFSQVRRRQGALLQVGVYSHWPGRALAELLALDESERADLVRRLDARVCGLGELLADLPDLERIAAAFATALARRHGIDLAPATWSAAELEARAAALPRFAPLSLDTGATAGPISAS